MADRIEKTDDEWRADLTPEQYEVCRKKGTERPFTGKYVECKDDGVYRCVCCGNERFSSDKKFNSGTGWPSFCDVIEQGRVALHEDAGDGRALLHQLGGAGPGKGRTKPAGREGLVRTAGREPPTPSH